MRDMRSRQSHYCKVHSAAFSDDARHLCAAVAGGKLAFYDLGSLPPSDVGDECVQQPLAPPACVLDCDGAECLCLASCTALLLCGDTAGRLTCYRWSDVDSHRCDAAPCATVDAAALLHAEAAAAGRRAPTQCPDDVLALCPMGDSDADGGTVLRVALAGALGGNTVAVIDVENGAVLRRLRGHDDYVHALCSSADGRRLYSAGEDGALNIWDLRQKSCAASLVPHERTECSRPHVGKWLGCVDANDNWLACGGGPSLGLWHLRSMALAKVLHDPDAGANDRPYHAVRMLKSELVTGGAVGELSRFDYAGAHLGSAACAANRPRLLALASANDGELFAAAGHSNAIDVYHQPEYRSYALRVL